MIRWDWTKTPKCVRCCCYIIGEVYEVDGTLYHEHCYKTWKDLVERLKARPIWYNVDIANKGI